MMNNQIEIFMATDDAINTLGEKNNMEFISKMIKENPSSNKIPIKNSPYCKASNIARAFCSVSSYSNAGSDCAVIPPPTPR